MSTEVEPRHPLSKSLLLVAGLGLLGLGLGVLRIQELAHAERVERSGWRALGSAVPKAGEHPALAHVALTAGRRVRFDVCVNEAAMGNASLADWEIGIWYGEAEPLLTRMLDPAAMRPTDVTSTRCQRIAQSERVQEGGTLLVRARQVSSTGADGLVPLRLSTRIRVEQPLDIRHHLPVWMVWSAVASGVTLAFRKRASLPASEPPVGAWRLWVGVAAVTAALLTTDRLPWQGASGALASGLWLGGVQVLAALALSHPQRRVLLGLMPPTSAWRASLAAIAVGVGLLPLGSLLMRWLPVPDGTPVVALAAWPSGTLALALVGTALPVAEELFFRGLIFGIAAARWGRATAFALTSVLFLIAHLPQVNGAWGAVAAIATTSVALTALRAWSGSCLPSALAHVIHNGSIALVTLVL